MAAPSRRKGRTEHKHSTGVGGNLGARGYFQAFVLKVADSKATIPCFYPQQDDFDKIPELQVCIAEALYDVSSICILDIVDQIGRRDRVSSIVYE